MLKKSLFCCSNETYGDPREVGINSDSWSELARATCLCHNRRRPIRGSFVAQFQPQVIVFTFIEVEVVATADSLPPLLLLQLPLEGHAAAAQTQKTFYTVSPHIKTFHQWSSCCKGSEVPAAWQFVVADNDCFRSFLYTRRIWVTLREIYIYILIQSVVSVPLSIFILIWWTIFSSMKKGSCLFWPSIHASFFPFKCQSSPNRLFSLPIRQRILLVAAVAITIAARDHHKLQKFTILKRESYKKELIIGVKGK